MGVAEVEHSGVAEPTPELARAVDEPGTGEQARRQGRDRRMQLLFVVALVLVEVAWLALLGVGCWWLLASG